MSFYRNQFIPIILTVFTFIGLVLILYFYLTLFNSFNEIEDVILHIRPTDLLVGITIYLKTSVDFALFIANLMRSNNGWKKRIAIELGTAIGNAFGTILVLTIWLFFKNIPLLLGFMILLASIVLIKMSQEGFEEFMLKEKNKFLLQVSGIILRAVKIVNSITSPVIKLIIPAKKLTKSPPLPFLKLILFSFSIPFILGLDDFAGYIPLFSIVKVFGFCVGVFAAHMLLNILLFISPKKTVATVENKYIIFVGSFAFLLIAIYGLFEIPSIFK